MLMSRKRRLLPWAFWALILVVVSDSLSPSWATGDDRIYKNIKYPQQILIIRHAEKTGESTDIHLSEKGKRRADVLDQLFARSSNRPAPFPKPDFIFAAHEHKD